MCRDLQPGEAALKPEEQALLDRICKAYYLPAWCSISDYRRLFEAEGLQVHACQCCFQAPVAAMLESRGCAALCNS